MIFSPLLLHVYLFLCVVVSLHLQRIYFLSPEGMKHCVSGKRGRGERMIREWEAKGTKCTYESLLSEVNEHK